MDSGSAGVGASLMLILLFAGVLVDIKAERGIKNEIASSCELSGSFVVKGKAYKCELIK
tara:strand:- start:5747 stop:5923 length:177 start_codon:yes stop_codon:yes gene_type:complete